MKIFAIEFTNWCNAKCGFCPYPTPAHTRKKGYMSIQTLDRIIQLIEEPREINISGLGEPTLHPQLVQYVQKLSSSDIAVQLNTNGQQLVQRLYDQLVEAGLKRIVLTSDYFPWKKGKLAVDPACPITFYTISRDPDHPDLGQTRKELDDWAGQVGPKTQRKKVDCSFVTDNFVQITWDGTVQRCCCDFNANEPLGSIFDPEFVTAHKCNKGKGISLCDGCAGYRFESGMIAGNFTGEDTTPLPDAFVSIDQLSLKRIQT